MFHSIPSNMSENARKQVAEYVNCLIVGSELPNVNLKLMQDRYTTLLTWHFRKRMPVTSAKRLAKTKMTEYFEMLMSEFN